MLLARISRRRRALQPVEFIPAKKAFQPQVKITMTRDVNGWLHRKRKQKFHLAAGRSYHVDEDRALEFIVKGYATGTPTREISEDELKQWHSEMKTVNIGG